MSLLVLLALAAGCEKGSGPTTTPEEGAPEAEGDEPEESIPDDEDDEGDEPY
jgi:hypothetical protein